MSPEQCDAQADKDWSLPGKKHTPAPWIVRPSSNPKNGTGWRDIVSTGGEFSPAYVGEALEHDALLISAAPELLAALEEMVSIVKIHSQATGNNFAWAELPEAIAAIAKARGQA